MKNLFLFPLLVTSLFFLNGCWNRIEINDLAIESMVGLDWAPHHHIRTTAQIVVPNQRGGGGNNQGNKPFFTVSEEGRNLIDDFSKVQEDLSRQMIISHRRIIIIGEKLAREGVHQVLDELIKRPEERQNVYVLVAHGEEAQKLLNQSYPLETLPSEGIRELVRSRTGLSIQLKDFLLSFITPGISPVAASIRATKNGFALDGTAVFRNDRLVGYLNPEQTQGLLWLRGNVARNISTVSTPDGKAKITVRFIQTKTSMTPSLDHGRVHMDIRVRTVGKVVENNSTLDLSQPRHLAWVQREVEKRIRDQIAHTVSLVQHKYHADIFGFGTSLYRVHPKEWNTLQNNWEDMHFPRTEVAIHVQANIRNVGMSGPGLELKEEEITK